MKWHVSIEAKRKGFIAPFFSHWFVDARTKQAAARTARECFANDYEREGEVKFIRCSIVEPDIGVLTL